MSVLARLMSSRTCPPLLFLAVALVAAIPAMTHAPLMQDSFWIDHVWSLQFSRQIAAGTLYPRWLPGSFDGLGAPVFYFYAPLPFYVAAGFSLIGLGTWGALLATFVGLHAGGGVAMHRWLGGRGWPAIAGALLFMLLPYHMIDFVRRGAIGEFAAFATIPLVAHGLHRAVRDRRPAALAVAYAALILSHLPTALLVSLFLLPALALRLGLGQEQGRDRGRGLVSAAVGLALGAGLAALYWLPALALQDATSMATMWRPGFTPDDWALLHPERWTERGSAPLFAAIVCADGFAAALLLRGGRFWPALAVVTALVAAVLIPGLWSLPLLAKVQFPWRLLSVTEFAIATAVARGLARPGRRVLPIVALVPAGAIALAVTLAPLPPPIALALLARVDRELPDVIEYLPRAIAIRDVPTALALARRTPHTAMRAGVVTRRRFWFPDVVVRCDGRPVATDADPATGLLRYRAGGVCDVTRAAPLPERIGGGISLIAVLGLVGLALHGRRARRTARRTRDPSCDLPTPDALSPTPT